MSEDPETRLRALWEAGRASWPGVPLPLGDFLRHFQERPPADPGPGRRRPGDPGDLYLACACAHQVPQAIEAFERDLIGRVHVFLSRRRPDPVLIDEVRQRLREKLLLGQPGAAPKIAGFQGRGSLLSWVRTCALRIADDLQRDPEARVRRETESVERILAADPDPEVRYLKERYGREFQAALRDAFARLSGPQRTALHLQLAGGLSTTQIGALFGINQSTVVRRLAQARQVLFEETWRLLHERLGLSESEFASLLQLVRSQLHASLDRLLEEGPRRPPRPPK